MKRTSLLLALVLLAVPLAAQDVPTPEPTATGGGMYHVIVGGDTVSQHTTERIAAARAFQELARCVWTCTVTYRRDYEVRMGVRWLTLEEEPAPEPEPEPEPEPTSLHFRSTWGTALGNSEPAIKDGDAWPEHIWCMGMLYETMAAVEGAGVGWTRTPNVLRVRHTGVDGDCGAVQRRDVVPASTTHWGRLYFRSDLAGWGGAAHNFSYNFVGDIQTVFFRPNGEASGWFVGFSFDYAPDGTHWSSQPHPDWALGNWVLQTSPTNPSDGADYTGRTSPNRILLDHHTWYRYEWMMEYVTPTTVRYWPRIYNMAGELLYDAGDFYPLWHGSTSLREWQEAGGSFGMSSAGLMRNIGIGNEGRSGGSEAFWYVADFAVSLSGWVGR